MTKKSYKRGWTHTRTRGKESSMTCDFCGRKVPKYKTFSVFRGFRITDPVLRKELGSRDRRGLSLMSSKVSACPACARRRNIVKKRK